MASTERSGSRREEILSTAADLFWAKGYSATAMSEVAAALGMQKASLYHHVRTKDTLLYEISISSMRHIIDNALRVTEDRPLDRLRAIVERHVEALLSDQRQHAVALTELRALGATEREHVMELRDRYDRLVEEAIRETQVATGLWAGIPPKILRLALLGMLNWTVFWYEPGGSMTPAQVADSFFATVTDGLGDRPTAR